MIPLMMTVALRIGNSYTNGYTIALLGLSLVILDNNRGEVVAHSFIAGSSRHQSPDTALERRTCSEVRNVIETSTLKLHHTLGQGNMLDVFLSRSLKHT